MKSFNSSQVGWIPKSPVQYITPWILFQFLIGRLDTRGFAPFHQIPGRSFNSSQVGWIPSLQLYISPFFSVSIPHRQAGYPPKLNILGRGGSGFNSSQVGWIRSPGQNRNPGLDRFQFLIGRLDTDEAGCLLPAGSRFNSSQVGWILLHPACLHPALYRFNSSQVGWIRIACWFSSAPVSGFNSSQVGWIHGLQRKLLKLY